MVVAKTARKASAKVKGLLFDGWWRERVVVEKGAEIPLGDLFADYRRECSGAGMSLRNFEDRLRGKGIRVTLRKGARWCSGVRLRVEVEGYIDSSPPVAAPYLPEAEMSVAEVAEARSVLSNFSHMPRDTPVRVRIGGKEIGKVPLRKVHDLLNQFAAETGALIDTVPPSADPATAVATYSTELRGGDAVSTIQLRGPSQIVRVTPYNPGESEAATMLMLDVSTPDDMASGRVAEELFRARVRQRAPVEAGGEGYSNARDDHYAGDLALAASAYAFAAGQPEDYRDFLVMNGKPVRTANFGWHVLEIVRRLWPWDAAWWKPRTAREDLVRAGALVIAAIEKIDRAEARGRLSAEETAKATGV